MHDYVDNHETQFRVSRAACLPIPRLSAKGYVADPGGWLVHMPDETLRLGRDCLKPFLTAACQSGRFEVYLADCGSMSGVSHGLRKTSPVQDRRGCCTNRQD
ncbi:hypothetical protein LIA77_09555 [Sarocladium implicatum]|nr:hypothetical protein LIA77_09555 [Sarocladium implicatum]